MKKYRVALTDQGRQDLHDRKAAAQELAHARILLKADAAPAGGRGKVEWH